MLLKARWVEKRDPRTHRNRPAVLLTYAKSNGKTAPSRLVPPDGALTIGEAALLVAMPALRLYRAARAGRLALEPGAPASVRLAELRRFVDAARS
jgi:hypothetical protein